MKRHPDRCPTPEKRSYDSNRQAIRDVKQVVRHANTQGVTMGPHWYAYRCECGALHLTTHDRWYHESNELVLTIPLSMQEWAFPKKIEAAEPQKETP